MHIELPLRTTYRADATKWKPALESVIVYLALAPFDNEVSDLLHRLVCTLSRVCADGLVPITSLSPHLCFVICSIKADKRTEDLPSFRALLTLLTTDEIIPWPVSQMRVSASDTIACAGVALDLQRVPSSPFRGPRTDILRHAASSCAPRRHPRTRGFRGAD